jgi:hypothetical protein
MNEQLIQITPVTSLFDLNKNQHNFSVHVRLQASEDFDYAIVTQQQLDSEKLVYKRSEQGYVSLSVANNLGQPKQIYYIAVKNNKPLQGKLLIETDSIKNSDSNLEKKSAFPNVSIIIWVVLFVTVIMVFLKRK